MKKPIEMQNMKKNLDNLLKKHSDKQQWTGKSTKESESKSNLVQVSLRMDRNLKATLEKKALENKKNHQFPYSLTDFIIQACNEYVERNKDYFEK